MGKNFGQIYKRSQYQLSTLSLKAPVSSSSEPQTSSAIELKTTSFPSETYKHQNNYVFNSQNTIHNDATITNNDNIKSCETPQKQNYIISTISTPDRCSQYIASTSSSRLDFNTSTVLPPVGK